MTELSVDVWAMMLFSILAFFGVAICALVYTLRQEERKMDILRTEERLDTYSPVALLELRTWIETHPDDPDQAVALEAYEECVVAVDKNDRHFHDWSDVDPDALRMS